MHTSRLLSRWTPLPPNPIIELLLNPLAVFFPISIQTLHVFNNAQSPFPELMARVQLRPHLLFKVPVQFRPLVLWEQVGYGVSCREWRVGMKGTALMGA